MLLNIIQPVFSGTKERPCSQINISIEYSIFTIYWVIQDRANVIELLKAKHNMNEANEVSDMLIIKEDKSLM